MTGKICGTGSWAPDRVWDNNDLAKMVKTNDEWIRERTGVVQRHIAKEEEVNTLILGAWGCGVFGNDAEFVANSFKKELEEYYADTFENIIFAIPGGTNYMVFKRVFGK